MEKHLLQQLLHLDASPDKSNGDVLLRDVRCEHVLHEAQLVLLEELRVPFVVVHYFFLLVCEAAINAQQGKEETQGSSVLVLVDVWQGGEDVSGALRHLHMEQFDPEQTKIAEAVDGSDRACSQ